MDELSPEARVALDALRDDLPDSEARARMRQRVLTASVGAAAGTLTAGSVKAASAGAHAAGAALSAGAAGGTLASLSVTKLVLVVASLGVAGVGAGVLHRDSVRRAVPSAGHEVHARAEAEPRAPEAPPHFARGQSRPLRLEQAAVTAPMAEPAPRAEPVAESLQGLAPKPARGARKPNQVSATREAEIASHVPREDPPALRSPNVSATPAPAQAHRDALEPAREQGLEAESALLLEALSAFEANHPCQALNVLAQHQEEFGESARLAPERERMRERIAKSARARHLDIENRCNAPKGTLP